jgi:osmotically-inducible protein OsmY
MTRFLSSVLACILGVALSLPAQTTQKQTAPDNTKTNERDHSKANPVPTHQNENDTDLKLTQDIRRAITKDKSLSSYAHNVKVITQNGNVTLRGPVRSADEKATVEAKAAEVAGANHVKSELEVAPAKIKTEKTTKPTSTK